MGHSIGLITQQKFCPRRAVQLVVRLAVFERVANDALDALARIDILLGGDLVGSSLFEDASSIGVNALGVLPEHNKIDVLRFHSF